MTDQASAKDTEPLGPTASRLWRFMKPHRWGLLLSVIAFVLVASTEPLIPKLLGYALGEGFNAKSTNVAGFAIPGGAPAASAAAVAPAASATAATPVTSTAASVASAASSPSRPSLAEVNQNYSFPIWMVPIVLIGLFAVRGLFTFCGQYMLNWTISRTVMDIRTALLQVLLRADARVYTSLQPATAVTKVVNDPQHVITLIAGALITILRDGLPALALMGFLFFINWKLTLLSLITVPGLAFVVRKVNRRVRRMGSWAYDAQLRLVSVIEDVTRAWRVVRSFDAADYERRRFAERAREVQRSTLKTAASNAMAQPLSQLMASVGMAGIPGSGMIVLPLVMTAAGLPGQVIIVAYPLLQTVDWIIARVRSGVNVMGDMQVAILLDAFDPAARVPMTLRPTVEPAQGPSAENSSPEKIEIA